MREDQGQHQHTTSVHIRQGAYLPHWTKDASIYSVTFRLADSLPVAVVNAWRQEREMVLRLARQNQRPINEAESRRLQYLFSSKVDNYLDRGRGACWMMQDEIAQIVVNALHYFDEKRYSLNAWCVMPNHVHVVVQPYPTYELSQILHSWKSLTAKRINKTLSRRGRLWQPEYYDHLIRDESDLAHSVDYVLRNPERAGLKDWKWVGFRGGQ